MSRLGASRRGKPLGRVLAVAGAALALAFAAFPFVWMLSTSLKSAQEVFLPGVRLIPPRPTLAGYREVLLRSEVPRYLWNGVVVVVLTLAGQLVVVIPAAYAFARLRFRFSRELFFIVIAGLVFPRYIATLPNFLLLSKLGLINTYGALVLPFVGSAFGVFFFRQHLAQIPQDFLDAAAIDGCGLASVLTRVLAPMIGPAVGAFAIFSAVAHWNDFFWPLVAVQTSRMFTPPAGVVHFAGQEGSRFDLIMTAAIVVITPLLGFFLLVRRGFLENLVTAQLK